MHVVDADKLFPNAKVSPPPAGHKGFKGADGSSIPHKGFITTRVKTNGGANASITWKNAAVEMPILSTHELARQKTRLEYEEEDGWIVHKPTDMRTRFIQRQGVYFVKLFFQKAITGDFEPVPPFQRQG